MSVTAATHSGKRSYVAAASLLKNLNTGDQSISTDAVTLTHQNFAAEGYQPGDEEEDVNLVVGLIADIGGK
jgi:hypothetical protein